VGKGRRTGIRAFNCYLTSPSLAVVVSADRIRFGVKKRRPGNRNALIFSLKPYLFIYINYKEKELLWFLNWAYKEGLENGT
jgi:hypothetical protein